MTFVALEIMKNPKSIQSLVLSFALFAAGCGPDCAALCEDGRKCDGAVQPGVDCEESCEENEKNAEAAGCERQYEEMLSCLDDQADLCTSDVACEKELSALTECVSN